MTKIRRKLIEVALPLEAINIASSREKLIRHGHPSTLHLWWARRPLAAARAVIFAQMVDDPSEYVDILLSVPKTKRAAEQELKRRRALWEARKAEHEAASGAEMPEPGAEPTLDDCAADIERKRLFAIVEDLVRWENTTNELVLEKARSEIWQSWRRDCANNADHPHAKDLFNRNRLPGFHDPFAGGGALPLEGQRLGLEAWASDLNPVAVLINKAMIEIPPRFAGLPPVNPERDPHKRWKGAGGLAEDVRYYGNWMRDEAEKRISHLYPKIQITAEMARERRDLKPYVGRELTANAWLWARTVNSPNPAFRHVDVPLASTFMLSTKAGKEAYVVPVIENGGYRFTVKVGKPSDVETAKAGTKLGRGANFRCLMSGSPIEGDYIKSEGRAERLGARLLAIVVEGDRERVFLSPTREHEVIARQAVPEWRPEVEFFQQALGFRIGNYGMTKWSDLFTPRQLTALVTFADLVAEARATIKQRAREIEVVEEPRTLAEDGTYASAYGDAVGLYLAIAVSRATDYWGTGAIWEPGGLFIAHVFTRNALPMTWDYPEANPFGGRSGSWNQTCVEWIERYLKTVGAHRAGSAIQADAQTQSLSLGRVVSTDPPYYDNIGYADLSDYFYVWLRRSLRSVFPDLFATVAVPKAEELVATPGRHGGRENAEKFFLDGMSHAMYRLSEQAHPVFPITIYYAFKQAERDENEGSTSTGWETFLDAVIRSRLAIVGTWPVRTERPGRIRETGSNALASSIVLVCRTRPESAPAATRREFLNALKAELPAALSRLQRGNIAPVDLAQAAIGPGMAVFTRYSKVVDTEGKQISVRDALATINQVLDEVLAEQEGDFDPDSRFAIAWFEQFGFNDGEFGVADVLARAKNTAVAGLDEAGIVISKGGKVRLLRPQELPEQWDPTTDPRLTIWESVHHLIRVLEAEGESTAAELAAKLGAEAEIARELAYRLYTVAERKRRAAEALSYNGLVQSWPEIIRLARDAASDEDPDQTEMFN
ncbi:MAG: DUF1156 domain-containing protein [Chloroflexi bacterium]|nr:DUF1156 domain-containing protein [Chloroflexota bacterium]